MNFIMYSAMFLIIFTIIVGVYFLYKGYEDNSKIKKFLRINLSFFVPLILGAIIILVPDIVQAASTSDSSNGLGYLAAALSTGLAAIGSGYAVALVGSAALGAVSENEKILGKTIIFVGLAEGIAIYGLIISILILQKV
ncbi:MAG: ATP synthase subunit C [Eubacteriaceae bacterium]